MTLGPPPKDGGWLPGEPTMWLEGWNFQPHSLTSEEESGSWGLNQLPMANYLINHDSIMKPP